MSNVLGFSSSTVVSSACVHFFSISIVFGSALFLVRVPVLRSVSSSALYHLGCVRCFNVSIVLGLFLVQVPVLNFVFSSALYHLGYVHCFQLRSVLPQPEYLSPIIHMILFCQLCQSDFNARSELQHPS